MGAIEDHHFSTPVVGELERAGHCRAIAREMASLHLLSLETEVEQPAGKIYRLPLVQITPEVVAQNESSAEKRHLYPVPTAA